MLGFGSESFLQLRCKSHSRVGQPKGCSWPVPVIGVNENHTYRKTALRRKANDIRLTRL
jgi:hypothetical protein